MRKWMIGFMMVLLVGRLHAGMLAHWPFDDAVGLIAQDRCGGEGAELVSGISWVQGAFGTALSFSGDDAFVQIPEVQGLNGSRTFSISFWTSWNRADRRQYPNLLTSENWCPHGLMFFMNQGALSFRMGLKNPEWKEMGVGLLDRVPTNQWTHLCVTFDLPEVTAFVNGRVVGRAKWNEPLSVRDFRLGGWQNGVCHDGLIDDLRIYREALSASEVAALAMDARYTKTDYQTVSSSCQTPEVVVAYTNRFVVMGLDGLGRISTLRERETGRELIHGARPMVEVETASGRKRANRLKRAADGSLLFRVASGGGDVRLSVHPFSDSGWIFRCEEVTVPHCTGVSFCRISPVCKKWVGTMANLLSDESSGVMVRALDLPLEMRSRNGTLDVRGEVSHGWLGMRAGICAGPREVLPQMARQMALAGGVPFSTLGGPWSLGADENRGSYLFADLRYATTDDWIDLARRGGFSTIHLHGWWERLGQYPVNRTLFPRGLDDLRSCVERIHAAGLRAGIHTLTACIPPNDPWIAQEGNTNLLAFKTYTLAAPVTRETTEIYVVEPPWERHDVVFTYSGNGNALRIGTEIVQYTGVRRERPYAFTGCKRGAFSTTPQRHLKGEKVDYLQQRYIAFYPDPDSTLADDLASCIAKVFRTGRLDQIYFDGSEGMMSRYGIDAMRHKIFKRLQTPTNTLVEASCHGAHNWWFHSRIGAWDHPVWGAKRFHDRHIRSTVLARKTDLLEPQMGWWAPRSATALARGHVLEEMEYFACKNSALDAAMSIQGVNVSWKPLPFEIERQMTVMGWYERFRLARAFAPDVVERLGVEGAEFQLRQNEKGVWQCIPAEIRTHRTVDAAPWRESFSAPTASALRVEALYDVAEYDDPKGVALFRDEDMNRIHVQAASEVTFHAQREKDAVHGAVVRLTALNRRAKSRGAWGRAALSIPHPYLNAGPCGAFGLWVKGDGKGALLNVQVVSPREYTAALSDHYVRLDFKGWRYVELLARERDVSEMGQYDWPYGGLYEIYRNGLDMAHLSGVNLYVNDLPCGETTAIEVGVIRALPIRKATLQDAFLKINGQTVQIPFPLRSGEMAEWGEGLWRRKGENGEILTEVEGALPRFVAGRNEVSFSAQNHCRAEVTLFALGEPFDAIHPKVRKGLSYEAMMPLAFAPSRGVTHLGRLVVRPDERARISFEIMGAAQSPVLCVGPVKISLPVTCQAGQRILAADGKWMLVDQQRKTLRSGVYGPNPLFSGTNPIRLETQQQEKTDVRLKIVKHYQ